MCIIDILLGTSFNALLMVLLVSRLNAGYMCFQSRSGTVHRLLTTCGIRPTFRAVPTKHLSTYHEDTIMPFVTCYTSRSINTNVWCLMSKIVNSSFILRDYRSTCSASHYYFCELFCLCFLLEVAVYDKIYTAGKTYIYIVGLIAQTLLACVSQ